MLRLIGTLIAIVLTTGANATAQLQPVDPNRWEPDIHKFEAADKQYPPVKGGIVFIGSSSIARWSNLAESFPNLKVVNRGFGGSELGDSAKYANRVVVPHAPRIVVLYAGENDLNRGVSPDEINGEFAKFAAVIRSSLPNTRLVVIGLKPSLSRWHLRDGMQATNKLIRTTCEGYKGCAYVDVWPSMLGKDGKPKPEFFVEDGLHMTPEGYKAWTQVLRPHLK
jgi:lysophospholipase L1-like esterase